MCSEVDRSDNILYDEMFSIGVFDYFYEDFLYCTYIVYAAYKSNH